MPGATTGKNIPFAIPTDRLADGAEATRKLAQSVDNMVQAGSGTIPITAQNTSAALNVVFPVAYSAPPRVVACVANQGAAPGAGQNVGVAVPTAAGVTIFGIRTTGAVPFDITWIAVGPVVAVV